MFPGPGPPGLQDPECGRPVDLDTLLESTGVSDMVSDLSASVLPGSGIQILNGCSYLAYQILAGLPWSYITGLAVEHLCHPIIQFLASGLPALLRKGQEWCLVHPQYRPPTISSLPLVAPVQHLQKALINWFQVPGLPALQQMVQEWCLVHPRTGHHPWHLRPPYYLYCTTVCLVYPH